VPAFIYWCAHSARFNVVTLFYSSRWHNFGRGRRYYIADSARFILSSLHRPACSEICRAIPRWKVTLRLLTRNFSINLSAKSPEVVFELVQSVDLMLATWIILMSASEWTNSFRQSSAIQRISTIYQSTQGLNKLPFSCPRIFRSICSIAHLRKRRKIHWIMRVIIFVRQDPVCWDLRVRTNASFFRAIEICDECGCKPLWNALLSCWNIFYRQLITFFSLNLAQTKEYRNNLRYIIIWLNADR